MNIIKKAVLFVVVLVLSYFSSEFMGNSYDNIFGSSGSFIDLRSLSGLPLSYIFFLTLFFTAFADEKKYWWMGILLIPAVWFEIYFDWAHIYFPVILGLVGWGTGFAVSRFLPNHKTSLEKNG